MPHLQTKRSFTSNIELVFGAGEVRLRICEEDCGQATTVVVESERSEILAALTANSRLFLEEAGENLIKSVVIRDKNYLALFLEIVLRTINGHCTEQISEEEVEYICGGFKASPRLGVEWDMSKLKALVAEGEVDKALESSDAEVGGNLRAGFIRSELGSYCESIGMLEEAALFCEAAAYNAGQAYSEWLTRALETKGSLIDALRRHLAETEDTETQQRYYDDIQAQQPCCEALEYKLADWYNFKLNGSRDAFYCGDSWISRSRSRTQSYHSEESKGEEIVAERGRV